MRSFAALLLLCSFSLASPRIFVTNREEFEAAAGGGAFRAGVHKVNPEQIKTLNKICPDATITSNHDNADYVVVWDSKTWAETSWTGHMQEFTVYQKNGDLIGSGDAQKMGSAAKDICRIILKSKK